jgi:hypothetical protein
MSPQRFGWLGACWPPLESTLRQAFGGDPEALTIVGKDSDRPAAAAAKDEQAAGKRIGIELLAAELREGVNPPFRRWLRSQPGCAVAA